jgi:ParB family chromosome partitioning protein
MEPEKLHLIENPMDPLYDKKRLEMPLSDTMVCNIMQHGVIEPIKVRKNGEKFEVVIGRQRVKNAREANVRLVKAGKEPVRIACEFIRGDTDAKLYSVMVSENEHRTNDDLVEKATKVQKMLDMGSSSEEICIAFGIGAQTVKNWLKILDLSAPVKTAIRAGQVSASAAMELVDLPKEEQTKKLEELKHSGKVTGERIRRAVQKNDAGTRQRIRSRKEIEAKVEESKGEYLEALQWVLRIDSD